MFEPRLNSLDSRAAGRLLSVQNHRFSLSSPYDAADTVCHQCGWAVSEKR
jgi:hypothetical protein